MALSEDLARIALQEQTLVLSRFDEEVAWRIGLQLRELAIARQYTLAIDVRRFGQVLFFSAVGGATPNNADWVRRKSNLVARFFRSSYGLGLELQEKNTDLEARYGLPFSEFAAHGGCFPIAVAGAGVVGSVAVSGLPQRADHELVVEVLCKETGQSYASLQLAAEN
ncbi:MAG TPA: heme-degrading domain-containing protein [Acidobacteriaceae bacterium]|nr:heme-degrading domain-containing protein [Acidobacteriaceae bacterium]